MRQKRPRAETSALAADVHVHQQFVEALAKEQATGVNFYGQAVYPAAKRTRRCQARSCRPFMHCFQGMPALRLLFLVDCFLHMLAICHVDPVPAPPEPAIQPHLWGYLGSLKGSLDVDGDLARRNGGNALPFSKEEDRCDRTRRLLYASRQLFGIAMCYQLYFLLYAVYQLPHTC